LNYSTLSAIAAARISETMIIMSSTEVSCVTCVFTVKRLNARIAAKESGLTTTRAQTVRRSAIRATMTIIRPANAAVALSTATTPITTMRTITPTATDAMRNQNSSIHEYNYKPEPIFYGDSKRYFGVELEIDEGGKNSDNADTLLGIGNRVAEHIYIKFDGSLNDGMEIVTHPMSLKYHKDKMPWAEIMKSAIHMDYRSHKTSTCGLHVHVNRTAFGSTREAQDECISRVLYFVEHHWLELLKFSRRTEYQMNRWAARYGYKNSPKEILEDAKKGCNGRYACVNITNYHTIEFRMFRGTLKYNTLIATLELVDKICELATDLTDTELKSVSWSDFVGSLDDSTESELITYLKERQLYINTPITTEEDD
jgi:hypothetical protein